MLGVPFATEALTVYQERLTAAEDHIRADHQVLARLWRLACAFEDLATDYSLSPAERAAWQAAADDIRAAFRKEADPK